MNASKILLMKVRKIIQYVRTPEELYYLTTITNMYIDKPIKEYKVLLETYCELIESSIELDTLEENTEKYVK